MNHSSSYQRIPRHQQLSILGNHFAYNIAGYNPDFAPHYSGTPAKYVVSQNLDLISAYDYHHAPAGYPYAVLQSSCSWPVLADAARTSPPSTPESSRTPANMEKELQILMDNIRQAHSPVGTFLQTRSGIVTVLNDLAIYWISQEATRRQQPLGSVEKVSFVRPFGSYGLGICGPDSDLDAVLIAPRYVRREEFFEQFVKLLSAHFEVIRDVAPVENAFVPVVKFTFEGVEVDLTFATLAQPSVTAHDTELYMDDMLVGMDEKSVRSLNGWRVCRFIQLYVPSMEVFRNTLLLIKTWAKARLIYSNSCGYLGGVSWAILVAYVCHEHPSASTLVQIRNFFACFAHWDFKKPVLLHPLQLPSCQCFDSTNHANFEPKSLYENHLMPIMTPCYPYQNSSFNVTRTTFRTILDTIRGANKLLESIEKGSATWADFLAKADPVTEYNCFLVLLIQARDDSSLKRWKGCVESKVRQLMQSFENIREVTRAQIYPASYRVSSSPSDHQASCIWLVGIEHMHSDPARNSSIKKAVDEWRSGVNAQGLVLLKNDQNGLYSVKCAFKSSAQVARLVIPGQDNVMNLSSYQGSFGSPSPHASHTM